jgi:hypothetical protein
MLYYHDMQDKYGFDDGNLTPVGARLYRRVYVEVMNKLLAQHSSNVRLIAVDGWGCHNCCMIMRVSKEVFDGLTEAQVVGEEEIPLDLRGEEDEEPDQSYDAALEQAMEMDLDNWVHEETETKRDPGYDDFLNSLGA